MKAEVSDIRHRYAGFLKKASEYFSQKSSSMILSALELAAEKLDGQKRYDGSPFLDHSVNTAMIVISEIGLGRNSTISTLLHDPVRLGLLPAEQAGELYGVECTPILHGLCNISDVNPKLSKEQADNFRDLIVSYSTDPRVILIKLADRLEVMRNLSSFPKEKRLKKSWESLNLYAQIAHKLGLYSIKSELEDISLSHLEPREYKHIVSKLEESEAEREAFIEQFLDPIVGRLRQAGIKHTIKSRTKSVHSIWSKMKRVGIPFEEVYDLFALRIIIDCPREMEKQLAWNVYSIVTDYYTPNPERMRDWISIPKSNGYESLHTTVVTKEGKWVEIQIRSERMNEVAERGIAAHWRYKGVNQGGMGSEQWLAKVRELMEADSQNMAANLAAGAGTLGEIFVFTPNGDLRKLPEGATLLDFAFDIHTGLGSTCTGGRVNQRNVQIREVLHNGDIVEIFTSKTQRPKADWLNAVVTSKARNKIRAYLREEQAKAANLGREELERKLKNWKLAITIDDAVVVLCKYYKVKTGIEIYARIASGKIGIAEVKELLSRHLGGETLTQTRRRAIPAPKTTVANTGDALIIDDTIKNLDYKLAKCCNPIFGDDVFGFVTVNAGITIHRGDCPNARRLREQYPYRVLPAQWRSTSAPGTFQAAIRVVAENTTGMVNRITEVISQELKINIRSMSLSPNNKGEITGLVNIEVNGTQIVDMVIYKVGNIKGVVKAYRIKNQA
ncbi:MAG: RelA/SpoT family protein [Rikenellaceae bacterium]|nr:RelA/SpoT family protein [Rikenellaceae bacterium]